VHGDPVAWAEKQELHRLLIQALNMLSEPQRSVIMWRVGWYTKPLKLREIGEVMGQNKNWTSNQLHKALRRLCHPQYSRALVTFLE